MAAIVALSVPAAAADLSVVVKGVRNGDGRVLLAVCTAATFLTPDCALQASAPAKGGAVTVVVHDVPPGRYAVQTYHDENGNKTLDRGLFGIPLEGIGFSNDAPIRFGPPDYAVAEISVAEPATGTAITLRYFTER
ncbi:DUF2141 domain-containing protein [Azospirillum sp. RWY-5-1]|uniref:DUF2141 domain-containing protein n=2 Tax=Azospirillum oleiclasticum TaxID=2735135 RepID=A0ABX2T5F5_9PROT|nr:DUF2141 domain-containing protein [Azospirillum oleiclasticum]NYZ18428.1 DUF2141 domain-containing protein [Azospirillum oleiclasticum]